MDHHWPDTAQERGQRPWACPFLNGPRVRFGGNFGRVIVRTTGILASKESGKTKGSNSYENEFETLCMVSGDGRFHEHRRVRGGEGNQDRRQAGRFSRRADGRHEGFRSRNPPESDR